MKGINVTRVLLGGLLAGILINVSEFILWGLLLEGPYEAMMAAYGLAETSWAMTAYLVGSLVIGFVLAFTYAAMRPRFGPGWRTAVTAAGVIWTVGFALPMLFNGAIGLSVGAGASVIAIVWGLAELALAAAAAGWVYQDQEALAPAAAARSF